MTARSASRSTSPSTPKKSSGSPTPKTTGSRSSTPPATSSKRSPSAAGRGPGHRGGAGREDLAGRTERRPGLGRRPERRPGPPLRLRGSGEGQFDRPTGVYVDSRGYVWISDARNDRVEVFDESGEFVTQFGQSGSGDGELTGEGWMRTAVGPDGEVLSRPGERAGGAVGGVLHTSLYSAAFGSAGAGDGQFKYLTDVAVDPTDGTIWVTDDGNDRIQHFSAAGQLSANSPPASTPAPSSSKPRATSTSPARRATASRNTATRVPC